MEPFDQTSSFNEKITHIRQLIAKRQKNLRAFEDILASYGIDRPIHLVNSLTFEQEEIQKLEAKLANIKGESDLSTLSPYKNLHNLPRRSFFAGRQVEIDTILGSLDFSSRTFVIAIEGIGGIGKSSLALEVGYRCWEEKYFASIIWISAKNSILTTYNVDEQSPDLTALKDIFTVIGFVLKCSTIGNAPLNEQETIAKELLGNQTTLLIIDNFETLPAYECEQIINFLRRTPVTVKAIITSRDRIAEGQRIFLQGLSEDESKSLLNWITLQHETKISNDQIEKIILSTGGLPLAILWIEGQISNFGYPLNEVLMQLELNGESPLLKFCFERSWNLLSEVAKSVLFLLALNLENTNREAINEIIQFTQTEQCNQAISEIVQLSLIIHDQTLDRFGILDLTRKFVLTQSEHYPDTLDSMSEKIFVYYLELAENLSSFDMWREYDFLLQDKNNILAAAQWCNSMLKHMSENSSQTSLLRDRRQLAKMLIQLAKAFGVVLWQKAFWLDRLSLAHIGLEASELLKDWEAVGNFSRNIVWIYFYQRNYECAKIWAQQSLAAFLKTNDVLLIASAKRALGNVVLYLQEYNRADQLLKESIEICLNHQSDDYGLYSLGFSYNGKGDLAFKTGDLDRAEHWYKKAIKIWQSPTRTDPIRHLSICLNNLGFVALEKGDLKKAHQFFSSGLDAAKEFSRQEEKARAWLGLGKIELKRGTNVRGIALIKKSLQLFQKLGMQYEIHIAQQLISDN